MRRGRPESNGDRADPGRRGDRRRSAHWNVAAAAGLLRDSYGQDAVHVAEAGLRAADDAQVAAAARAEGRAVVTENVADFAAERDVVLVFVLKKNLPAGGGQGAALAKILDRWTQDFPDPYLGHHWPRTD